MSFEVNSSQQISFNDSVFSLTAREKKALDNSYLRMRFFPILMKKDFLFYTAVKLPARMRP
jgi:uncharacterized protein YutD